MKTFSAATLPALALCLASAQGAFFAPKGQANGVYRAYYNENGTEVHEFLHEVAPRPDAAVNLLSAAIHTKRSHVKDMLASPKSGLVERGDGVTCATSSSNAIGTTDLFNAISVLDQQCGDTSGNPSGNSIGPYQAGIGPGSRYVVQGTAIAYVCNYEPGWQQCWPSEVNADLPTVFQACVPGAFDNPPPPSTNSYGWYTHASWGPKNYGFTWNNGGFC